MNKEIIVKETMPMIYKISKMFYGVEKEDLVQAGITGVLKALERYNDNQNCKFSSYAYFDIIHEMNELVNKKVIKVNKDTLKLYKLIEKTRYLEAQKIGKIPTNEEIACILNIPLESVDYACMSASVILSTSEDSENTRSLYEKISVEEKVTTDDLIFLNECLETLSPDEQNIIKERYLEDKTQSEVAKKYNMTQVMVSRLENKSIEKMRSYVRM